MEEVCELQEGLSWNINLICFHSMRLSWSVDKLFSWPSYIYIYIYMSFSLLNVWLNWIDTSFLSILSLDHSSLCMNCLTSKWNEFRRIPFLCVYVCVFVLSLFVLLKMTPVGAKSFWEKYSTFLNSFHPKIKCLIWRFEQIKDKIGKNEVSV